MAVVSPMTVRHLICVSRMFVMIMLMHYRVIGMHRMVSVCFLHRTEGRLKKIMFDSYEERVLLLILVARMDRSSIRKIESRYGIEDHLWAEGQDEL